MSKQTRNGAASSTTRPSNTEVRALAKKSKTKPQSTTSSSISTSLLLRGLGCLIIAAAAAVASQELLSPVYGAIPASIYHEEGLATVFVAAWTSKWLFRGVSPRSIYILIPLVAFAAPITYSYAIEYSSSLGPVYGPVVTQLVSGYPIIFLSILSAGLVVQDAEVGPLLDLVLGIVAYGIVYLAKVQMSAYIASRMGTNIVFSRLGLQYLVANVATVLFPSGYLILNVPAILHFVYAQTHSPLPSSLLLANEALRKDSSYEILARHDSVTGYVSVIEDKVSKFRLMRCDHSLLGGEWLQPPVAGARSAVREPVFSVFVMLEAVRLIEPGKKKEPEEMPWDNPDFMNGVVVEEFPAEEAPDGYWDTDIDPAKEAEMKAKSEAMKAKLAARKIEEDEKEAAAAAAAAELSAVSPKDQNALVIGLGVGIAAKAMIGHGINTTTVEIDPVVDRFAVRYFGLPAKRRRVIANARVFLREAVARGETFDYVIHDVFTGGAVPGQLFTLETFEDLRKVLKPNGAVAINYAGDLQQPEARLLVHTIRQVFPECRIYREMEAATEAEVESQGFDLINMIIFCSRNDLPFNFRAPTKQDFLESEVRKQHLVPIHEVEDAKLKPDSDMEVLRDGKVNTLTLWQQKSAVSHWRIMRQVIGAPAWEMW